ncbi:VOC family protein [Novosphingobium mangrovi (ex Huang et al. 2023)]|uniref:VOC family protein n=1 Tax=Novosphingobium mangrovi (ex Huang et al. 2023) TaxID=2976432 RepID=A0ABT2IA59_9SPHN|nr:VOC family protein [Novosphingobium mangrovi (ex Huang et al. 2023)]MCT2401688.1 VOC family protein [Novosphingobium mangrovi (ex Huang et al. 2023)]
MLDHIGIGASDFTASCRFYDAALAPLGISRIMELTAEETGGYAGIGYGKDGKPFFWLGNDGPRGPGVHIAFRADSRAEVDAFYAAAMQAGGRDNGRPGLRPHYHPSYYGAFVFDPDGLNIEAVCHKPE